MDYRDVLKLIPRIKAEYQLPKGPKPSTPDELLEKSIRREVIWSFVNVIKDKVRIDINATSAKACPIILEPEELADILEAFIKLNTPCEKGDVLDILKFHWRH